MQVFTDYSVYSDQNVCSLMFMRYVRDNDAPTLISNMKKGDPVNVLDYTGTHKEIFNKVLVDKREYEDFHSESQDLQNQNNRDTQEKDILYYVKYVTNLVEDCILCKCGLEDLKIQEKLSRQRDVELELLEEQRQQYLKKSKFQQPDEYFNKRIFRSQYYRDLKINPDQVTKFWSCLFSTQKNNMEDLFALLDIQLKKNELQEYNSYSISNGMISLSENDFAQILKLFIIEDGKTAFDSLRMLALRKCPLIIQNVKDFEQILKTQLYEQTAFSMKNFQSSVKIDYKRNTKKNYQQVQIQEVSFKQNIKNNFNQEEEEYSQTKNKILTQYNNQACSESKIKLWNFFKCLNQWIWVKPIKIVSNWFTQFELKFQVIPQKTQPNNNQLTSRKEIAVDSSKALVEACNNFDHNLITMEFFFQKNLGNFLALFLRIYDIYGLGTLAFDSQVGWFSDNQILDPISTVDGSAVFSSYTFFFFMTLSMCIAYAILGRVAVSQISNNTFGLDEQGNPISWTHPRFWLSKLIILISGQFIFVMKTFFDAFICDYSNYPYTLVRYPQIECLSDPHSLYIIFAIIGAFIYYPLSTFLQPTFQFSDHSLDLKYKSTYIVIYIQAKLLILGISTVFSNLQQAYLYQMLFASLIMLMLIIIYNKMMPCYVKWFNQLELTLFAIVLNCYFGAFLILLKQNQIVGWVYTGIMIGLIQFYLIYLIKHNQNNRNQVRPQNSQEL